MALRIVKPVSSIPSTPRLPPNPALHSGQSVESAAGIRGVAPFVPALILDASYQDRRFGPSRCACLPVSSWEVERQHLREGSSNLFANNTCHSRRNLTSLLCILRSKHCMNCALTATFLLGSPDGTAAAARPAAESSWAAPEGTLTERLTCRKTDRRNSNWKYKGLRKERS